MLKVYVAGPDVFRGDAEEYLETVRELLAAHDLKALIPIDNEIETGFGVDAAAEIYKGNIQMIDDCDVVMANIEPFRGPHMDPGTAFEIGYAVAKGKKIYAYTPFAYDTLFGRIETGTTKQDDDGNFVEDFGETENLMITVPAECIFPSLKETVAAIQSNLGVSNGSGQSQAY